MSKHKDVHYTQALFDNIQQFSTRANHQFTSPLPDFSPLIEIENRYKGELRKMKKFRFQLLHRWLTERFLPCRVADIGGGKGLLAYLLQESGWETAVIDPVNQALPTKYKNIATGKRIKVAPTESVPRISKPFATRMGQRFDLLIGMHAHGCNARIIDAATAYDCGFILFPCCVIDEPFYPPIGVQWLESLTDYAARQNHATYPFRLNFKGQNIGLYSPGGRVKMIANEESPCLNKIVSSSD
ncbi:MAG: class I SAM-dependent methyltransferase, partial [Chloroflexi bacterium]|nr:class I SAM-dependent methyltransferase [Chloroflexota bacterium]